MGDQPDDADEPDVRPEASPAGTVPLGGAAGQATDTALLSTAPLTVVGRVLDASNIAVLARLGDGPHHVIYKPIVGERPLWDFPDGHLAYREAAASIVCSAGGWDVIPPTVLRDGPLGPGSAQAWVTRLPEEARAAMADGDATSTHPLGVPLDDGDEAAQEAVRLFPPDALPAGWLPAFAGELSNGAPVVVAHADTPRLASLAVLDAVLNNSDRKGSHVLTDEGGVLWGIDHGVTLHQDDKLRTVLWGWAGELLPGADLERLRRLRQALAEPSSHDHLDDSTDLDDIDDEDVGPVASLRRLLTEPEMQALQERVERLVTSGRFPHPSQDWPAIPWPPL